MPLPRTLERLVEDQAFRAQAPAVPQPPGPRRPVVALSRLPGAGGEEVAVRLSQDLGYELFDREIIQRVATSARLSEQMVEALDERERSFLTEWLETLVTERHLSPHGYLYHLTRVVGALAHRGGAVIVGRGAHLILAGREALRVLVAAPLEARVAAVALRAGVRPREARRRIEAEEAARHAFLRQYFRGDPADPCAFDLVVNPHGMGMEVAVESIKAAVTALAAGGMGRQS